MNSPLALEKHARLEQILLKSLGVPAIHHAGVMIYQMDCVQALKRMPPNLIDLTVTSPPYNIGKEYETKVGVDRYVSWCEQWIDGIDKVSTSDSAFWLNLGYLALPGKAKCLPISYLLWDKIPFFLLQEVVWNYAAGVAARNYFSPRNEKFLWYVKDQNSYTFNLDEVRDPNVKYPNQKKNGKLKCNPLGKNPTDVWEFPKVTSGAQRASPERTAHPAQFPVAVIDRIVRACSNPGDIVLDPFMGSGTTAEVALNTGRFVLGFELEPKYIEIAAARLDNLQQWRQNIAAQRPLAIFEQEAQLPSFDFS